MRKMGWEQGAGLGKNQQGITAPLIMKKTDSGAGQIAVGTNLIQKFNPHKDVSPVILLLNAVGRGDVDDELQEEMRDEAAKYGKVVDCKIVTMPEGVPDGKSVRIFIEYADREGGAVAKAKFSNRYFGGRYVNCLYFEEGKWRKADLYAEVE